MARWLLLSLSAMLVPGLSACAALLPAISPSLPLLSPASLGANHDAVQLLQAEFEGKTLTVQCIVQAHEDAVSVIALGPLDSRVFTLRYDGQQLQSEVSPYVPLSLPPERVLSDLQLALWPMSAWQQRLAASGWQLVETSPGQRELSRDGHPVASVSVRADDAWHGLIRLSHRQPAYTLSISPIDAMPPEAGNPLP